MTMKAIVVEHNNRGGTEKLLAKTLQKPENPKGHDLLVRYVFHLPCIGWYLCR